jgi:glutamyl-tRNA synthetase
VIRLAVPLEGSTTLHDLIHGNIVIPNESVDDQVLIKSDSFPTYHLAVVVDDHLMKISHVLRADEWISSFPKHILLYRAFDWEPPLFGHVPIVLGPDRKKLSKRHGATSVDQFRNEGYLPEALVNFLALLGWSWDDKSELFTRAQLIELFSLDHLHHSAAIFDRTKLDWMNGYYIRSLDPDDLAARLLPFLTRAGLEADLEATKKLAPLVQERLKRLDEIVSLVDFVFLDKIEYDGKLLVPKNVTPLQALNALRSASQVLEDAASLEDADALERSLRAAGQDLGLVPAQYFGVLRVALTGKTVSPPLVGTLPVLGRAKTSERISNAIARLEDMVVKA